MIFYFFSSCCCEVKHIYSSVFSRFYHSGCTIHAFHVIRIQGHFSAGLQWCFSWTFQFFMDDPFMILHWVSTSCRVISDTISNSIKCACNCCFSAIHTWHMIGFDNGFATHFISWIFCFLQTVRDQCWTSVQQKWIESFLSLLKYWCVYH